MQRIITYQLIRIYYIIKMMKKHHYLKQLTVSDVCVALINQQHTEDRTASLKEYLYKTVRLRQQQETTAQQLIILPEFALQQMTEEQLFNYHLQRNNWSADQWLNYESLLESVNTRHKKIIDNSSSTFERSDEIMNQLIEKLKESYNYLHENRQPLTRLNLHLQNQYLRILKKIRKINSMSKALDVMKLWNKSNISKTLRIRPERILQYQDIDSIFRSFQEISHFLHHNREQLISHANLLSLLDDRKKQIVMQIYNNAIKSIKEFSEESDYGRKFDQYSYILANSHLIPNDKKNQISTSSIFGEENLQSIIDKDIHDIYFQTLSKKGKSYNLELLNQDLYIDFFAELMQEFNHYFSSWHKVTTFHFHRETPFKDGFIKYRTVVFQKMFDRISQSLKFSTKFTFISLSNQLELFQKIQDFIDCGQQWMGKCKNTISSVLQKKYRQQMETFFKVNNGEIKSSLFEEFSINVNEDTKEDDLHFKENDKLKLKLRLMDQMMVQVRQFSKMNINLQKIQRLLYEKHTVNKSSCPETSVMTEQELQTELKTYYQSLTTKLGFKIFKSIVEYQLRESYLPDQTQLTSIYQHLEFTIFIVYKVCIPNYLKREIEKQIFNDLERDQRLSAVKVALTKNVIDQTIFTTINELRHIFLQRNSFGDLYDFLVKIGNKYEGTSITTYLNVNLYFQQYEKYESQVKNLHEKFLTVMNELYLITEYLQKSIESNRFFKASENTCKDIVQLKEVIQAIVLVYFTVYFESSSQKYYKYVLPLFMNLRFDIKKLSPEILVPFKDYRTKVHQIYRQNSITKYIQPTCFNQMLTNKQTEYFFKFLIDLFSKIQKINQNGRHILKSQILQFTRLTNIQKSGNNGQNWLNFLDCYVETSKQRNQNFVIQKVTKFVLEFPIQWWKSNLIWVYHDYSSKEKKEYLYKLVSAYYNRIFSLPRI